MKYKGRVLFVGHCYYNAWYLSRALRQLGWKADVLNTDGDEQSQIFYHGEDFRFFYRSLWDVPRQVWFYLNALHRYDIFHFSNAHALNFGGIIKRFFFEHGEIKLLRKLGKKIVYSNNGCLDGVSQTSFRKWGPIPVCDICPWKDRPDICSDERNLTWGKIRNSLTDYQCLLGGNRVDYNVAPHIHEVPEFYCLDKDMWHPDLEIPEKFRLSFPEGTIKIYHSVGNFDARTTTKGNIKSTHIYLPIIERLKAEGHKIEWLFFSKVPNKEVRFYQAQADIFVDMLTFGFFGAIGREAMMLGKPYVCFLRPEWLKSMREEIPGYVDELPVVNATPETVYTVLKELITNKEKRLQIGIESRKFAVKWHSAEAGALRFDKIYSELLNK